MLRADPPGIFLACVIVSRLSAVALSVFMFAEEGVVECTVQTETAVLHPEITKLQEELAVVQAAHCHTQTVMQAQVWQSHRVAPAPSMPQGLRKLHLHFSKPGVKNGNDWRSKRHSTGLSSTTAT